MRARPLALAPLAALVFLPALGAGFLSWDDNLTVVFNEAYRGFSPRHLLWMLESRHYGPWQPLSWLSYAVDHAVWGLWAPGYRLTNLLLHGLSAYLLARVARHVLKDERAALLAALLWALHPMRVESVVWITERRDVLSAALLLGAWLLRLEGRERWGLALYAGALMAKGTSVALPIFLLATDRRNLLPWFALAAAGGGMNLLFLARGDLPAPELGPLERLSLAAHSFGFYAAKTVLPVGLSPYYPMSAWSWAYPALALLLCALLRREPLWWATLAALAPVSGLLQSGAQLAADRYAHLATIPLFLMAARLPLRVVAPLAVLFAALSFRQSFYWRDDVSLWTRAVALYPDALLPRSNLALALHAKDPAAAMHQYREWLRIAPKDVQAYVNLAALLVEAGRGREAEFVLREALAHRPGEPRAATNLAGLRALAGDRNEAKALLEDVLRHYPEFEPARRNLELLRPGPARSPSPRAR